MGGYSTAFDLVSSEYGWPDEIIWELPLRRFRQITAAIQRRKYLEHREENYRFSWMTRNLARFIAGGYMVEKGKENRALDVASSLAIDDIEAVLYGNKAATVPSADNSKNVPVDPDDAVARALERNTNGSFERFMGMTQKLDQRGKMI